MHVYAFVVEGEEFGNPKRGSEADYDSRFVRLSEVVDEGHTRCRYDDGLSARRRGRLPGRRRLPILPVVEGKAGERGRRVKWHKDRPAGQGT